MRTVCSAVFCGFRQKAELFVKEERQKKRSSGSTFTSGDYVERIQEIELILTVNIMEDKCLHSRNLDAEEKLLQSKNDVKHGRIHH